MNSTTENVVRTHYEYSHPITRWYRLQKREDKVPKDELPWEFIDSNKRISSQANRAFAPDGPATILFALLRSPYFYTLFGEQLEVAVKYRHARCIRNGKALDVWRKALRKRFGGCYLYKFEVGLESDVIHVHVVAEKYAGLLELSRVDNQACKPVTDPKGLIDYLEKPPCYPIRKRVKEYNRAKSIAGSSKPPKVSGYVGLPGKAKRFVSDKKSESPVTDVRNRDSQNLFIYRPIKMDDATRLHS